MPNRVVREGILDSEIKRLLLENRLAEINDLTLSMPKVKAGDPLQGVKWHLACERRRVKIKLSKRNGQSHTLKDEFELIKSVKGKCAICGNDKKPSIDHIIPISKGGHDGISNLQILCSSCNSKKGNKHG